MNTLEARTKKYIEEKRLIAQGEHILLALSGGADSTALFWLLLSLREALGFRFCALHVNHGLRGEAADADEAFVRALCEAQGIHLTVETADVAALAKEKGQSIEEAGRQFRREALLREANSTGAAKIALAHQLDDVAETVLINLIRGAGIRGAASIRAKNEAFIRPLLFAAHTELCDYLTAGGHTWREDETNASRAYLRNRIRLDVLPYLKKYGNARVSEHLAAFANAAQEMEETLGAAAREKEKTYLCKDEEGNDTLRLGNFANEDPATQIWLLQQFLADDGTGMKDVGRTHLQALRELALGGSGKEVHLPGARVAYRSYDAIVLLEDSDRRGEKRKTAVCETAAENDGAKKESSKEESSKEESAQEKELCIPGETSFMGYRFFAALIPFEGAKAEVSRYTKVFDYDKIKAPLVLRTRRAGDFVTIHDSGQTKKLGDLLTDEKVDRRIRDQIPLLCAGAEVLLIPELRDGASARVDGNTKQLLCISYEKERND